MNNKLLKQDVVIVGSGGLAKEIRFLLHQSICSDIKTDMLGQSFYNHFVGYVDANTTLKIHGDPIIGNDDWLLNYNDQLNVVFGIGSPIIVQRLVEKFKQNPNLKFPNILHPSVVGDFNNIKIGEGNIFTAGAIFTTDIQIGDFNIFNLNTTVGHDTVIGDYNLFNPSTNISGNVRVNNTCLFGTGSQVLEKLEIKSNCVIGAGAVVTKSIYESGVYVGCPAKKIK